MRLKMFQLAAAAMILVAILPTRGDAVIAIAVTTQANLGFGQIVATTTSGTVTVSPAGSRTRSGGVVLGNALGVGAASFAVTGEPNTGYSITLPSLCTLSAGASSMTADAFTSSPSGSSNLGPSGSMSVTLGATLHVSSGQAAAAYSGTYPITVAYN
jgi:hypothetical protein